MLNILRNLPSFYWHFFRPYKGWLALLFATAFLFALTVSLTPYSLKLIVDSMVEYDSSNNQALSGIWIASSIYLLTLLSTSVVLRLYDLSWIKMIPPVKSQIIKDIFAHVEMQPYAFFHDNFSGSLANKIQDLAKGASSLVFFSINQFLTRLLSIAVGAITMYFVHPNFSTILVFWSVIFTTISYKLSKKSQEYSGLQAASRSHVIGKIVDSLTNILNVKLFAREKYEETYLQRSLDDLITHDTNLQYFLMKVKTFYALSIILLTGAMLWTLTHTYSKGGITIGDSALVLTLTSVLIRDVFQIASELVTFSEEVGTCKQALKVLNTTCKIPDHAPLPPLHVTKGEISFSKVHFKYPNSPPLFVNKSLVIAPKTKVGLVGHSGGGKTTFANLILRFYNLNAGQILIDGQDIHKVSYSSLREHITFIPQDLILFHRSIRENIRYGKINASDEEVTICAKRACCHEFIEKLPNGYDTLVGERGIKLSGGQKQRIAIARAMLKDAPILILDEATSSLDSTTEHHIQQSFSELMEGKTAIVIAHRLSTLVNMDRILVLHEGKIVEDGSHEELMALNGYYTSFWNKQIHCLSDVDEELNEQVDCLL